MSSDGGFVVVWDSDGQDGDFSGVYARRYDASGSALGDEFLVNTHTAGFQGLPSVGMAPDGRFVVAWTSWDQDGDGYGVYAQRYAGDGSVLGGEFQVNTYVTSDQMRPSVGMAHDGRFVVAWESSGQDGDLTGIFAQRFDGNGSPVGTEIAVNSYTTTSQDSPSMAVADDGSFLVVWESSGQDGSAYGVYCRAYDSTGTPSGTEFQVNSYTASNQGRPSIAMMPDGGFIVVWQSFLQDRSGYGVYAQRYDASRNLLGSEFSVNSHTTRDQDFPSTAVSLDGRFVVVWRSLNQDGDGRGIFGKLYSANAEPRGPGSW